MADRLKEFSNNAAGISEEARRLVNVLENSHQIAFFPKPARLGDFLTSGTQERQDLRINIANALAHTQPIQNISPTLTVSDRTKVFAQGLATSLRDATYRFLSSQMPLKIYNHCLAKITGEENLQTVRAYFNSNCSPPLV